jgi:FAD/FMN-containing dehydrogenase
LSLGAEGSWQIGGNISTNAGGTAVLRYGPTRDLVLGLEVVLPNGQVFNGLRALRKDNTGYGLKQLFIGAEGTLGIITAAVLKLFAPQRCTALALLKLEGVEQALEVMRSLRGAVGDRFGSLEIMSCGQIEVIAETVPHVRIPFELTEPWTCRAGADRRQWRRLRVRQAGGGGVRCCDHHGAGYAAYAAASASWPSSTTSPANAWFWSLIRPCQACGSRASSTP